jgi:hypothetical protein
MKAALSASRSADQQVGLDVTVGERPEHADLDGAEAAAAGQHEHRGHRRGRCGNALG